MSRPPSLVASAAPTIHVPHIDYLSILPMLIMLGGALVLMLCPPSSEAVMDVRLGTVVAVGGVDRRPGGRALPVGPR